MVQIRGAARGRFWPKAGAWPKWSKTEALPGLILARSRRLAEVVQIRGVARGSFWPEACACALEYLGGVEEQTPASLHASARRLLQEGAS